MDKLGELINKLEEKGIPWITFLSNKDFHIWIHNPLEPYTTERYKKENAKIIEEALIEVDYLKHR